MSFSAASRVVVLASIATSTALAQHPVRVGLLQGVEGVPFDVATVGNGFGQLLPHRIHELAGGVPSANVIDIRTLDDLVLNVTAQNPVLAPTPWPVQAVLPSAFRGNHFVFARFALPIDIASVLDPAPAAQVNGGLTGTISVVALDPVTGASTALSGRAFVGGKTFAGVPSGNPPLLPLQTWVSLSGGVLVANPAIDNDQNGITDGLGFPGTLPGSGFQGASSLVGDDAFVFVADLDQKLFTNDTFPTQREIRITITTGVRSASGLFLAHSARVAATVGADALRPEVVVTPPPSNLPSIVPGNGDANVDPATDIRISFTEPIQPLSVGSLPTGAPPVQSASIRIEFGPPSYRTLVPCTAEPLNAFDLTQYRLVPAFAFPGHGPALSCGAFDRVDVSVAGGTLLDLFGNTNLFSRTTYFTTGEGSGLVNAPVTPDAIYLGRGGATPGITVLDLNGFGASTGNPVFDATYATFAEGASNFPNNPNVRLQGSLLRPALAPGTCTVNGGASGVFRATLDSNLEPLLARAPLVLSIGDMMLGHALDSTYDDGPVPFGCQSGGGNLCASDGRKRIIPTIGPGGNTLTPGAPGGFTPIPLGAENLVSWAPHPNPPPLVFPPLCVAPFIGGQEPTSIDSSLIVGVPNLLAPGDPFGHPLQGIPPSGLLSAEQNAFFQGPSPPQATPVACNDYQIRQRIGHFLYVLDRARREIVVLDSNRMSVIDRVALADPTELAMSPNLDRLAVTNALAGTVSFVDTDPASATFHQVVVETVVGHGPRGIAWESDNEDVLVCNETDDTLSILSAASLQVRKTVRTFLRHPFAVAITPRQQSFGYSRDVYFGYVLNRNGTIAVFESGPNGPNGWGYDDMIGLLPQLCRSPKAIQVDPLDLRSAVWIAHEGPINPATNQPGPYGVPALSRIVLGSNVFGLLPLQSGSSPQFRDMTYAVQVALGPTQLSGLPADLCFDDLRNVGGLQTSSTPFSAGTPLLINGKGLTRGVGPLVLNANESRYLFAAVPNATTGPGVVDVIDLNGTFARVDTNPWQAGVQSIPAAGVSVLMDYFRQ